ncbi:Uncharacterised protein [uncultured archaeon]|nr:Uncharacterised protein [uncultured archaeon]
MAIPRYLVAVGIMFAVMVLSGCAGVCPPAGMPQPPGCGGTQLPNLTSPENPAVNITMPVIPMIPQQNETQLAESRYITKYLPSQVPIIGRVEFKNIEDLPLSITVMAWGEGIPAKPSLHAWFKDQQRKGAQHYSGVSVWNSDAWKKVSDLPPELNSSYATGFDGEPLYMQEDVYLNFLDPALQDYLKRGMKEHIDAGTDGFVFDEVSGTSDAVMIGSGPFDNYSLAGFRDYLKSEYTASELTQKGVSDINTFNYRDFLVEKGYRSAYSTGDFWSNPAPFRQDYYTYLRDATNSRISDLISYARSYAQTKSKTLVFTANADPLMRTNLFKFYDNLTVYVFEHEWFAGWRKDQGSEFTSGTPDIPAMKYARSLGTWAAAMPQIMEMNHFTDVYTGSRFFTHEMAETYAAMGYYMYFPDVDYVGIKFDSNRSLVYPFYNLVRDNPTAFLNLTTPAEVAVAKPFNVFDPELGAIDGAKGFSIALYQANVPHDVILVDNITSQYKVVVTTGVAYSDAEVEKLLSFARNGGTVIAINSNFATRDENNNPVSRASLSGLKVNGVHTLGKGKFIFFEDDLQYRIWAPRDPAAIKLLLDAVEQSATPNSAPANVTVLPYASTDGSGRFVAHVLNYDFNGKDFSNMTDVQVKVKLPEGYSAAGKSLRIVSPDFAGNQTITFSESGGILTFTLPSLYVWDVAILE